MRASATRTESISGGGRARAGSWYRTAEDGAGTGARTGAVVVAVVVAVDEAETGAVAVAGATEVAVGAATRSGVFERSGSNDIIPVELMMREIHDKI